VPPLRDGVLDFGTVVLAPDAAVRVRLRNVPAGCQGRADCSVADADRFQSSKLQDVRAFCDGVVVPAPSGRELRLTVRSVDCAGPYFCAAIAGISLQPGERRDCDVDIGALPVTTLRVVGPSPEILGQLVVHWFSAALQGEHGEVRLDEAGLAELRGVETERLSFKTVSECSLLPVRKPAGPDLELAPESRLAGLRLRGADGAFVPFALRGAGSKHALLNIVVANSLAAVETVTASADGIGTLRWPTSAIAWNGDVGILDVGTAARGADLIVTPSGEKPKQPPWLRLLLGYPDGKRKELRHSDGRFRAADLVPGNYTLRWQISDHPGPVIADPLVIHGGASTELVVPWPVFTTWQGIVTNWRAIPVQDRIDWVRFGNWKSFAEGAQLRVDDAGGFAMPLPEDSTGPGDVVEFRRGTAGFAGRVVAVDRPGHRVLVEHPPVRWIGLRIVPRFGGDRWMLLLREPGSNLPWGPVNPKVPARVPLPPGGRLEGELCEWEDRKLHHTTCFVTIDGSLGEVTIAPAGGHWCTVRLERAGTSMRACLLGPDGKPCLAQVGAGPEQSQRLWVPEGARGIQVTLEAGGVQNFAAEREEIVIR
jgi:hypothetical protein